MSLRPRALLSLLVVPWLAACGGAPQAAPSTASGVQADREIISRVAGDSPNFAQLSNGNLMTVVSRDFGRGAKAGALVEFFYPNYATDHLWDSYVGIQGPEGLHWAHDLKLVNQRMAPDSGLVESRFEGPGYSLLIQDVMRPGADVHLRRLQVHSVASRPLVGLSAVFYAFFTLGGTPGGDTLVYDRQAHALTQRDGDVTVTIASDRSPEAWQCGDANLPLGGHRDARQAAEAGAWPLTNSAGPMLTGVNGATRIPLPTLAPGETTSVTYALAAGTNPEGALATARSALDLGWEGAVREDAGHWQAFLARGRQPALPALARDPYRRALITLRQHMTRQGAIIAAPTYLDPPYRFVWPRDGSMVALTLLQAGYREEGLSALEFIERLQRPTGGWAINYFPDGLKAMWDFGDRGNEHDEVATFPWAIARAARQTGDDAWLRRRWGAVRKACEFLLSQQRDDGLLTTCRDLWELDSDGSWTYSNGAAVAGLESGAAIAQQLGDPATARRYQAAASRMRDAMGRLLVSQGAFARGLRQHLDGTVEMANLALGSPWFGVFGEDDPRMRATIEAVSSRLMTPGGGVRRYEGDRYYDGQPWPVATGWLALARLAEGQRPEAERLFSVMTGYAHQTDALMLGEQFDEQHHRWVSAFPLAWSEATYVRTALELYP